MRRKIIQIAAVFAALCMLAPMCAAEGEGNPLIRVGIYYGDEALASANLENSVGAGYQFGYFGEGLSFVPLAQTGETQITVLKTQNMYMRGGAYSDQETGGETVIGCYHLQLPGSYASFEEARQASAQYAGGFAAWSDGAFYARVGAYASRAGAEASQRDGMGIVGTSAYGVSVVATKSAAILFQFDGGAALALGVQPLAQNGQKANTWFKGYKYFGNFRYERVDGGNLTVCNIVSLEDYVRGVLPYEMSNSWPLEALKAQAVCARTYAWLTIGKGRHTASHFDICTTTHCQVYRGNNSANALTDQAVDETWGVFARYNGGLAETYYFSHDGGATEDVRNVWNANADLPYLVGVIDPYEAQVIDKISGYNWAVTYTKSELGARLREKGYNCQDIASVFVSEYTSTGNVRTVTFTDTAGKSWTVSKENVRLLFNLRSMRYNVSGGGKYFVDGAAYAVSSLSGAYAINGKGETGNISGAPYAVTAAGTAPLSVPADKFVFTGAGWGHNVGMSQWGAYAMAKQGYGYADILAFYFTGIEIY